MAYCPPEDRISARKRTRNSAPMVVKFRALYTDGSRGIVAGMQVVNDDAIVSRTAKEIARRDNVQSVLPIRIPVIR